MGKPENMMILKTQPRYQVTLKMICNPMMILKKSKTSHHLIRKSQECPYNFPFAKARTEVPVEESNVPYKPTEIEQEHTGVEKIYKGGEKCRSGRIDGQRDAVANQTYP